MESIHLKEPEAIFTIVLRNLALPSWENLVPEAQLQMIEEAARLMKCDQLPTSHKQQLGTGLYGLHRYVPEKQRERISQILTLSETPSVEKKNCA